MKTIVILISGRGSNLRAIVEAAAAEKWEHRIAAVISNRADAGGLDFARAHGIATDVVESQQFTSREAFDAALQTCIDRHDPDLVVLAGFMRILTAGFVNHFAGRMLNIHPSLLPSFPGLATHQRALDAGVRIHGVTIHFVTPELDHGPIVAQAAVPVLDHDTAASLSQRVLQQEHRLYPRAIQWFLDDQVHLDAGRVRLGASCVASVFH